MFVKTLRYVVIALAVAVSSVSCMTTSQIMAAHTDKPDGVNNNMVYGYIDFSAIDTGGDFFSIRLLPIEYELTTKRTGLFKNRKETVLEPEVSRSEQKALMRQGWSMVYDGLFRIENLAPGEYYLVSLVHSYTTGSTTYTGTFTPPRPERGNGIQVGADQMIYWGAYNFVIGADGKAQFEVSSDVTRKDIAARLAEAITGKGWGDLLASQL